MKLIFVFLACFVIRILMDGRPRNGSMNSNQTCIARLTQAGTSPVRRVLRRTLSCRHDTDVGASVWYGALLPDLLACFGLVRCLASGLASYLLDRVLAATAMTWLPSRTWTKTSLPGWKSCFRAGFRPDSNRESFKIPVVLQGAGSGEGSGFGVGFDFSNNGLLATGERARSRPWKVRPQTGTWGRGPALSFGSSPTRGCGCPLRVEYGKVADAEIH